MPRNITGCWRYFLGKKSGLNMCFICALWSPAGKGWPLGPRLWCLTVNLSLSDWYSGSGVVLDCIDYWSLHPYLLLCTCVKHENVAFADPEGGGGRGAGYTLWKITKKVSNTGPDPLKNHKAAKPEFNVGPLLASQRNADDGPLILAFGCLKN